MLRFPPGEFSFFQKNIAEKHSICKGQHQLEILNRLPITTVGRAFLSERGCGATLREIVKRAFAIPVSKIMDEKVCEEMALKLHCNFEVFSGSVESELDARLGTGIYLEFLDMTHVCVDTNCIISHHGITRIITATKDILQYQRFSDVSFVSLKVISY